MGSTSPFGRYRVALSERFFHAGFLALMLLFVRFVLFAPSTSDVHR